MGLASLRAQPVWLSATCLPCYKLLAKTAVDKPKMLQRKPKCKGRDGLCLSEGPLLPKHLNTSLPCSYKFKPVTPKTKTLHLGSSLVKFVAFSWHFIFSSHHCKQVRVNSCPSIHDTGSCFSFCPYMIPWEA